MSNVTAKLTYHNPSNNMSQIEVGSHNIQYGGSSGDGFCNTHQSFDCAITKEENAAVQKVTYPDEFFSAVSIPLSLTEENEKLKAKLRELETENDNLSTQVDCLRIDSDHLTQELMDSASYAVHTEMREKLAHAEEMRMLHKDTVDSNLTLKHELNNCIFEKNKEITDLNRELEEMRMFHKNAVISSSELKKELKSVSAERKMWQSSCEMNDRTINELKKEINSLKQEVKDAQSLTALRTPFELEREALMQEVKELKLKLYRANLHCDFLVKELDS